MHITRRALNIGLFSTLPLVAGAANAASQSQFDKEFAKLSANWLDNYLRLSPVQATQIGDHRFDAQIDDLSAKGRAKQLAFNKSTLAKLGKINRTKLSRDNQVDYAILENSLKSNIFSFEEVKEWEWNPLYYHNVAGGAVYNLMAREFAPVKERAKNAQIRYEKIPQILEAMRAQIVPSKVPPSHAKTYAAQFAGITQTYNEMVLPHLETSESVAQNAVDAVAAAVIAISFADHKDWIENTLLPNAKGYFRVGANIFDKALSFSLMSNLTRQDIKARALGEIKKVRAQMYEIAKTALNRNDAPINPTPEQEQSIIKNALDLAASERPKRNELVETSTKMTEIARKFVQVKDLITLPDGPVKVILMPEFQRGYAVAYCDSPGPLDKNLATYYAVSPVPDDWTEAQSDSFLKEYNLRGIQDIAVHEAMPGHYVQLFHANSCKSILRAVLSSGSFIEGWAVYAERVMVEQGFKSDDPLYRLTQLKVYLRTITNALIDQAIHCEGMNEEEMMKLLTQTAFQEESEARGKWRRAQLSYTQLSTYFVGFLEHFETREIYKAKQGASFNLKKYHDSVLSFGSPPMKYARALLMGDKIL
ncbi:MAG: DUF885 domain-containing protein [Caulobacterales bacterium]|nr:DUF885 domain-containing protein [Caulobacterales bacterium]MCA0371492.1 DUF885 domain-containing protein [Pseudomonadota bacterium]